MGDFLVSGYPWIKSVHVISVIAWMAGLFYLPRLFVYHSERGHHGSELDHIFRVMEVRLFRVIMNPAMISAWIFGLLLAFTPGVVDWGAVWPWAKVGGILLMTWYHHALGRWRKQFLSGTSPHSGRFFRMVNEVPTILMAVIVIAVIARPF